MLTSAGALIGGPIELLKFQVNKIEGTLILKLANAMVKRLQVKKFPKNSPKKFPKKFTIGTKVTQKLKNSKKA